MVEASISLMAPSGVVTRLPTNRMVGSSSSATTIALYGASSEYAGSNGGCGNMNDQNVPAPLGGTPGEAIEGRRVGTHVTAIERQRGHIGRGGMRHVPQSVHACTSSSPRAVPSQNGADVS